MSDVVKSGYIKRYSNSFMDGGWKKIWVVLHRDSKLVIYKKQSDTSPKGHVIMKDVCKYFAFGQYAEKFPERPTLPKDGKIDWVLAIPQKPSSQAKLHWFLCESDKDINEWMQAIVSTLPHKGEAPPSSSAPPPAPYREEIQAVKSNPVSAPPPPGYPAAPPPYSAGPPVGTLGFDAMNISGHPPAAAPPPPAGGYYPQQTYHAPAGYPQQAPAPQYQPPAQQYQQSYPQQQYPQQQYPQQQYPQQQYPQQQYYPQQPAGAAYPRQPYNAAPAQGYYHTQGQYIAYPQG
ncbi:proline-rich protein 2-like isoform X2 [Haliotis rubra]|uniref:proline-rich protein 2-like isoform X2 n=1 Tax=Haliotis rubra TaxID=36100 RepID=UPI001EE62BBF|nr:proline-rich protein 2-like isoform X2 [Haliotis rubra]